VKDENGNLFADSYNQFSQLLNAPRVSAVRQIEMHAAQPLLLLFGL
jgi:hypothetical protein